MFGKKINRAIILAAGDGDRMGELTIGLPKVLLPGNLGEPIIVSPISDEDKEKIFYKNAKKLLGL